MDKNGKITTYGGTVIVDGKAAIFVVEERKGRISSYCYTEDGTGLHMVDLEPKERQIYEGAFIGHHRRAKRCQR